MKLLHLCHRYYPYVGGSEKYFQEVSERFAAKGHRVSVFTTDAFDLEYFWDKSKRRVERTYEVHKGVSVRRFPVAHFPLKKAAMRGLSLIPDWRLRCFTFSPPSLRLLRESLFGGVDCDVVHAGPFPFEQIIYCARIIAARNKVPFLITPLIHTGPRRSASISVSYGRKSQLRLLLESDLVFAQTPSEASCLARWGVPAGKIRLTGVGINPGEVQGGDGERFRRLHRVGEKLVGHLAVKSFAKGTIHLIEAMKILWDKGERIKLCLAGHEMSEFSSYFSGLDGKTRENIIRLDFIGEAERRDFLAAIDLFAMPSVTESFGIVYLEAWANKVAVIGAGAGGVPDLIDDGRNGYLVEFGDVPALAKKIEVLVRDGSLAERFGKNGFEKVMQNYTWDKQFAKVEAAYEEITAGREFSAHDAGRRQP